MNTLIIEARLAVEFKYKPLPKLLSEKYRQYFKENIPEFLNILGSKSPLYTSNGTIICNKYDRIVIGDYGAFVEFSDQSKQTQFIIAPGQEYRVTDNRYINNVKYIWLTIDDESNIKIYHQKKTVSYADYIPGKYYISVHEVFS